MTPEPVVPISAIEHHAYCPRQCALIHVDGLWLDNPHTVAGEIGHRRVDSGRHRTERGRLVLRSLPLWSESLGLTGRADAVEVHPDGKVIPVEYKIGRRHGDAAHLQLCAQALCLEEMLDIRIGKGLLWFSAPRRRERVEIDSALRTRTLSAVAEIRRWLARAGGVSPGLRDPAFVERGTILGPRSASPLGTFRRVHGGTRPSLSEGAKSAGLVYEARIAGFTNPSSALLTSRWRRV